MDLTSLVLLLGYNEEGHVKIHEGMLGFVILVFHFVYNTTAAALIKKIKVKTQNKRYSDS